MLHVSRFQKAMKKKLSHRTILISNLLWANALHHLCPDLGYNPGLQEKKVNFAVALFTQETNVIQIFCNEGIHVHM